MGVKERIKIFAQHKGIPIYRFEELCSMSNGYVASIRKGLGLEKLENIQKAFPDLNRDWLLYGEGEMLNKIDKVAEPLMTYAADYNNRGSDVVDVETEDIERFSLPFVTNDIAQAPNTDIKALVTNNSPKLGRYPIGQKLSGVSYAQRIITDAMSGAYFFPGDVIFLKYIDKEQMISDSAYLLDTKNYGTLFRLVTIEKDGLLLRSCSEDSERFKSIFLHEDEVLSYAALVMQVRTSFSFSNGAHLAEMVKMRDEQIQMMTTSQTKLINEVCRQNERIEKLIDKVLE